MGNSSGGKSSKGFSSKEVQALRRAKGQLPAGVQVGVEIQEKVEVGKTLPQFSPVFKLSVVGC